MHRVSLDPVVPTALPAVPQATVKKASFASIFKAIPAEKSQGAGPLREPQAPGSLSNRLAGLWEQIGRDERRLDRYVRRALAGAEFDLPEIVAMQRLAFRYTQRVELLSKLVDRLTGAIRQTLQTQV